MGAASPAPVSRPPAPQHTSMPMAASYASPMRTEAAAPPTPASVDKRLSAEITEKLLQGWTLSSQHCPETGVPLLRTPKGELYSVRTGRTYLPEALAASPLPGASPAKSF